MGFNIGPRVIRATGGSISREGNFRVHTFPSRRVGEGLVFEVDMGNPNCTGRLIADNTFRDGIIKDLSGNGNDLTVNNAPTYGAGDPAKGGGHITFARSSNQYADKANPSGVRTHGNIPFTIEAWARRTNADSWNTVISMRGQYTQLGFHTSNFMFGRNGGGGNTFIFPSGAAQDTWYHLVMTYDGNSSYDIEAHVDGSLKATGSMGWNSSVSNTTGIRLGGFGTSSEMFTGNVAIARIYNRCLSRDEIEQNYDADKVRFKTYTNTFTPTCSGNGGNVEVLTVAGGGGGGRNHGGGGGGAGGLIHTPKYSVTNAAISLSVGAGGTGGGSVPTNGLNSTFGTLTAIGGGCGGSEDATAGKTGKNGGSGGGGAGFATPQAGGTATSGQGFAGGIGGDNSTSSSTYGSGAGGGGAGGIGGNGTQGVSASAGGGTPGPGGSGKEFDISGEKKFYAGGGGGGYWRGTGSGNFASQGGAGGSGIGGVGGRLSVAASLMGTNGLNYTGSGGGGSPGAGNARRGGNGGAGTVIVRYPAEDYNIEILVVAGGGGGGANSDVNGAAGGGGGAGGIIYYESYAVKGGKNYMVEVGHGGDPGSGANIPDSRGKNGHRSTFGDLLALGGGGGGGGYDGNVADGRNDGMVGGSGGGGGSNGGTPAAGKGLAGKGTIDQGNDGGNGSDASGSDGAGGGGGAGAVGGDGVGATATAQGGAGGIGNAYSITGTSTYYAGGGGGGGAANDSDSGGGDGGNGGGASGGHTNLVGNNATANTGGGGGGAGCRSGSNINGGLGGSGIVIIAYKGPQRGEGGAVSTTSRPGYTVHTFGTTGNSHKYLYIA